jgi:hypothetical protein
MIDCLVILILVKRARIKQQLIRIAIDSRKY